MSNRFIGSTEDLPEMMTKSIRTKRYDPLEYAHRFFQEERPKLVAAVRYAITGDDWDTLTDYLAKLCIDAGTRDIHEDLVWVVKDVQSNCQGEGGEVAEREANWLIEHLLEGVRQDNPKTKAMKKKPLPPAIVDILTALVLDLKDLMQNTETGERVRLYRIYQRLQPAAARGDVPTVIAAAKAWLELEIQADTCTTAANWLEDLIARLEELQAMETAGTLGWNNGTVTAIARQIWSDAFYIQDPSLLPLLADALEEAGYTNQDILSLLRKGVGECSGPQKRKIEHFLRRLTTMAPRKSLTKAQKKPRIHTKATSASLPQLVGGQSEADALAAAMGGDSGDLTPPQTPQSEPPAANDTEPPEEDGTAPPQGTPEGPPPAPGPAGLGPPGLQPPEVEEKPKQKYPGLTPGLHWHKSKAFTGERTDKIGRRECYQNGVHVPCDAVTNGQSHTDGKVPPKETNPVPAAAKQ